MRHLKLNLRPCSRGCEWDVGIHYIGDVHDKKHPFRRLFDYITDEKLMWDSMGDVYDELYFPNHQIPFVKSAGGDICVKAGVRKIIIKNSKAQGVELESGEVIYAKKVVSNAGARNTYTKLIDGDLLSSELFTSISNTRYSSGYFSLYLGLKNEIGNLNLPKANKWIFPSYDHDKNIEDYFNNQNSALPLTYISFPSAKDSTFHERYPGRETIDMLGASSMKWFSQWANTSWPSRSKREDEYKELKKKIESRYLSILNEYVPGVAGNIDYYESSTPLTTRDFSQFEHGEPYGLEISPSRFNQKWLRPKTPIDNLYLTGVDVLMGGVAGAIVSGAMTAVSMYPLRTLAELVPRGILAKN